MNTKAPIERGIPVPTRERKPRRYPWRELEVGESFVYLGNPRAAYPHAQKQSERLKRTFYAAAIGDGRVRVWRIA